MLHSLEYLQATVEFAAHTQTLTEKEHLQLDESTFPREMQGSVLGRAADDVSTATMPCFTVRAYTVHLVAVLQHSPCAELLYVHHPARCTYIVDGQRIY